MQISQEEMDENWNRIFNAQKSKSALKRVKAQKDRLKNALPSHQHKSRKVYDRNGKNSYTKDY